MSELPENCQIVPQKKPYKVTLEAGKKYWWCACGLSKTQPFCDGAHKGTGMGCVAVVVDETKDYQLCGCKHAKDGKAFCDGSHNQL